MSDQNREPVWDGQGFDPWLPTRLRASAEIAAQERKVYESFWSLMAEFLVAALRAVLASQVPDAQNVLAVEDRWHSMVANFVGTAIRGVIEAVFQGIFGPDVRFDSRPAVVAYLSQVENRLRGVDNEVYARVASTVARGTAEGWSIQQTSQELGELLSPNNPTWRNKATVVARTETIGALNAGRTDSFSAIVAAAPELDFQQQWLATNDSRTRPTHRAADGQRRRVGQTFDVGSANLRFPGDPLGPADEVIQCRCTTILVEEGREIDMSNRGFRGILLPTSRKRQEMNIPADLPNRFQYHPPVNPGAKEAHEAVRAQLADVAAELAGLFPEGAGREQALFLTKVEEAMFWANAAVARHWGSEGGTPATKE